MARCALCPGVHCQIPPHGKQTRGGLLFVGEAPGFQENKGALKHPPGLPFVGRTGEEVDRHYLPLAGLRRHDVTFHNAISCLPDTSGGKLDPSKAPHRALLESCAAENLYPLIEAMEPSLIVPMGNFACRAVFGDGFDLEHRHGIPAESLYGPAFPMFHPALGMHEPKKMLYIRTDWDRLRRHLRGVLTVPHDPYAGFEDYQEVADVRELRDLLDPTLPLASDTESSPSLGPFCYTFSQYPGTGRLILASRTDLIAEFQAILQQWESVILFHNYLYDWSVVEEMGLFLPPQRVVDTMAVVYHLGNMPQGLKALALRELGMTMQDFDDVVTPHSAKRALEYLELATFEEWPTPEPQMVRQNDGTWKVYKPQGLNTKIKRFFTDYRKHPEGIDVFERWKKWGDIHAQVEGVMGPFPVKDIAHTPFDLALFYAIRDADALGRLWPILKQMRTFVRRFSQEQWRAKVQVAYT